MALRDNPPLGVKPSRNTPAYLTPKSQGGYGPETEAPPQGTGKLLQFRQNVRATSKNDYIQLDAQKLLLALSRVTRAGGAIMFGLTQDGGAFSFLILDGDDKAREYPHGVDAAHESLDTIIETYAPD